MMASMRRLLRAPALAWLVAVLLVVPAVAQAAEKNITVVEKPKDKDDALDAAAGHFPGSIRITSKADLAAKVLGALGPGDCIKTLTIVGHGAAGIIGTGEGKGSEQCKHINGNADEWKPALQGLKGKFCAGAKIVIWGCNVGAGKEGAAKVKEIADYFGVPVEAQTGKVYPDGTKEPGSTTVTGNPTTPAPAPAPKTGGPCKPKKKPMSRAETVVPETRALTVFPNLGTFNSPVPVAASDVAFVTFVPPSLFSVVYQPTFEVPLGTAPTLTPDGQLYVEQNGIHNPGLLQAILGGIVPNIVADPSKALGKFDGGLVIRLTSGQNLFYHLAVDFEFMVKEGDLAHSLESSCDGSALYRLLTKESLPYTILNANLDSAAEDLLISHVVDAAKLAERENWAGARAALDQLNDQTQVLEAEGLISSENAAQIVFESVQLQGEYSPVAPDTGDPNPLPDTTPTSTPGHGDSGSSGS